MDARALRAFTDVHQSAGISRLLELNGLGKRYAGREVVRDVFLQVDEGQFVSLLGPSGSGKSTILRMIAGLIRPDQGTIRIAGKSVFEAGRDVPPEKRAIGMVFQDYALWPHMTVAQNIAFGLRLQHWPRRQVRNRIDEMLALVRLEGMADRYPFQLSGGQQQRVALARSLASQPRLLLLDEPLASLDTQLRLAVREELAVLLRRIGVTSIYVTHDQGEALEMSDRIVVMRDGAVEQIGSPTELYQHAQSLFVETFLGTTNMLAGAVEVSGHHAGLRLDQALLRGAAADNVNGAGVLCIRPEAIELADNTVPTPTNLLASMFVRSSFVGGRWQHLCALDDRHSLQFFSNSRLLAEPGERVNLYLPPEQCRILPPDPTIRPLSAPLI